MSPERYQRINALVESALELPADRRDEYLERACAGDEALRRETAELMAAREQSAGFLGSSALEFFARELAETLEPKDLTGIQIGRYCVLRPIGKGGMGEVWLARDAQLAREVALKLLPPGSGYETSKTLRFQREAQAASALNHPNIVTIYEIGETQGVRFIAEEFVAGETLRGRLAQGPLDLKVVVDVGGQIATALAASHAAGIVHRDIKPENVMLRPDGLVKVLDFGLARFMSPESACRNSSALMATLPGLIVGTVHYMSPEQVRGQEVPAAGDIFSLGAVLYEMIAGVPPFTGATAADVMTAILHAQPAPITRESIGGRADLQRIVRRCIEKDPAARYPSAAELRADLGRLARSLETAAAPRARRPSIVIAAVAAIAASFALLAVVYRARSGYQTAWSPGAMRVSRLTTRNGAEQAAISPDGKFVAYSLNDSGGQSLWVRQVAAASDIRVLPPEPGEHRGLTFSPDGNYLYYLRGNNGSVENLIRVPVLGGDARQFLAGVNSPIAFAPNGKEFAFIRLDVPHRDVDLMVAGVDGSGERRIAVRRRPASYSQFGLAWSPDGQTIACFGNAGGPDADNFSLLGVRVTDGREHLITSQKWADSNSPVWLTDGHELLLAGRESPQGTGQIWAVSVPGGQVRRITNDLDSYSGISLTADGKSLAAVQARAATDIWVAPYGDSGRAVQLTAGGFPGLESLAWTPEGKLVFAAAGGDYQNIWVSDSDRRNARQLTAGPGYGNELAVTGDGRYILFQFARNIWRINADGGGRMQLTHGALDVHPSSSQTGSWVVYTSFQGWTPVIGGEPSLWRISADGGDPVRLPQAPSPASFPEVSPDGKLLACIRFLGEDPRFSRSQIAIVPLSGGLPMKLLDRPADVGPEIHWPGNPKAIDFVRSIGGVDNIWRQRLDGGPPFEVTHFKIDRVSDFAWSRDGAKLALVRGNTVSSIVLITGFR